jgi:opacity protein-like surface antigen
MSARAHEAAGQQWYATPEAGWSDLRGITVGGRAGVEVVGGLDLVGQGLVFFPDESGVGDQGVAVDRSAWQLSTNAIYVFDRRRALSPYVGAGVRYGASDLTVVVDGLRASRGQSGFGTNFLGGVRFPRLPAAPFVEVRFGDETWTLTGGVLLGLLSG